MPLEDVTYFKREYTNKMIYLLFIIIIALAILAKSPIIKGVVGEKSVSFQLTRLDKGLVALEGFRKIPDFNSHSKVYLSWMDKVLELINDRSLPITSLLNVAVHLAKLEHLVRARTKKNELNIDYLLFEPSSQEMKNDLENLMSVFENTFIASKVITKKSEVIFNPQFGVSTALVSGADADIFIDGTLYDFKTSKDKSLKDNDNLQMIGYFLLNELAIITNSDDLAFNYIHMKIERLAFYKARYGEIEYYDVSKLLPFEHVKKKLKELAEHFKDNQGNLNMMLMSDIDAAKKILEEIRKYGI